MYTIYDDGTDTEVFERPDGTKDVNEFHFMGFSNKIHPYHKKQTEWAIEMLRSVGIVLRTVEVPTVYEMSADHDKGTMDVGDLLIKPPPYAQGVKNFILFQDTEMGRGWAVLLELLPGGGMRIITQDHRDTVRDQTLLDVKWLKKQGVSIKKRTVKDIDKLK